MLDASPGQARTESMFSTVYHAYHGQIQLIMNTITILTIFYIITESQLHKSALGVTFSLGNI